MTGLRRFNRRSFMARVTGGSLMAAGIVTTGRSQTPDHRVSNQAEARAQITDQDSSEPVRPGTSTTDVDVGGPNSDAPGCSRPRRPVTGITDHDRGANADPPRRGRGRGPNRRSPPRCRGPSR